MGNPQTTATAKKHFSIKWKIFAYLLGFCLLLLVVLWLFQTVFLSRFYMGIKFSQVESAAASLAALVQEGDMEAVMADVEARGDLFVEVVDENGTVTTAQGAFPEGAAGPLGALQKDALWRQVEQNGGSMSVQYDMGKLPDFARQPGDIPPEGMPADGHGLQMPDGAADNGGPRFGGNNRQNILCAKIVTASDGSQKLLVVSAGLTPVDATVEALRVQLLYVSAVMVVLSVGLALLLSRRVSGPIEKLNRSAVKLAEGDYGASFNAGGYREVDELSETLRHAAAELGKTEELRRDLVANVSHDLRTPLTLITGYAEMMRDIPGENNPENMQVIIDEAKRLSGLVGDLLDLSRLQSGTTEMKPERFELTELVEGIIGRFTKFSESEGYAVEFLHEGDVTVEADEGRISQVVYNFLSNAMLHGGDNKRITVRQTVKNGQVLLEVEDRGKGIPPEQLPYIWDRYYKIDEPHKRAVAGSGLGLSIVKSILQQLPGVQYGARSVPGEGSVFWFSLPAT